MLNGERTGLRLGFAERHRAERRHPPTLAVAKRVAYVGRYGADVLPAAPVCYEVGN
jgi:hypothetical protein